MAGLRRRGDDYQADLFEIIGHGLTLLSTGRLQEHDELIEPLVERYRRTGPPTCLNWSLIFLGMSAGAQGRHEESLRRYDEAAQVDLPDRTQSWNEPLAARAALRRGNPTAAFEILGGHLESLVATDDMHSARVAAAEFVNLMVGQGLLDEAAYVLDYLRSTNFLNNATLRSSLANAIGRLDAHRVAGGTEEHQPPIDDRAALAYMGDVLRKLAATPR